ncbi:MAG TPA: class D sortase [Thermoanaerobaculia bacterium]
MSALRRLEKLLWILGVVLIAAYVGIRVYQRSAARRETRAFEKRMEEHLATPAPSHPLASPPPATASLPGLPMGTPTVPVAGMILPEEKPADTSLWAPKRIREYEETLRQKASDPVAVLRISKLGIEVPVFPGTDDFALNRGVGWIEGTARPGEEGNSGIAGHRDGFFRPLKDIAKGDSIELLTLAGSRMYQVEEIQIVDPNDVQVLDPTPQAALTLVSCYPFYFAGSAPKRYIVRAVSSSAAEESARK